MTVPVLSVRNLRKTFGAVIASDDVSLDLFPGEVHALIGPNGAGKSTLIKQIFGEQRSDSGEVILSGRNITQSSEVSRVRAGLARSFQVSNLVLEYTTLQNLILCATGKKAKIYQFFHPVNKDHSLLSIANSMLHEVGLEARADTPAHALSHGERRRLEIAMALCLKPKAFLLDEPMAGMGPDGSKSLTTYLDGLRNQAPILLIEHDMDVVFALADRISVLLYGKIIASGSVDEIRNNHQVKQAYLGD